MQALTELEIKLLIKGGAQIDDLKLVRVNHKKKPITKSSSHFGLATARQNLF